MDYLTDTKNSINYYIPDLPIKYCVYSYSLNHDAYHDTRYKNYGNTKDDESFYLGLARRVFFDFLNSAAGQHLVTLGVAVSLDTVQNHACYRTEVRIIAYMSKKQQESWREYQIIDKLQNSF